MRSIAIVGTFLFPWGQAASRTVYGKCLALMAYGFDVHLASGNEKGSEYCEKLGVNTLNADGLGSSPSQNKNQVQRALQMTFRDSRNIYQWLSEVRPKPCAVIHHGTHVPTLKTTIKWCKKQRVPSLVDITEWNEAAIHPGGILSFSNLNQLYARNFLLPKLDAALAMTSFLGARLAERKVPSIIMPPTMNLNDWPFNEKNSIQAESDHIKVVYAGSPGNSKLIENEDARRSKDQLGNFLRAIETFKGEKKVTLTVLGPKSHLIQGVDLTQSNYLGKVTFLGRVPQQEVKSILKEADFSLLLRNHTLTSKAGFSTKFTESMAAGTPVICNLTGDLEKYAKDGENAIVLPDISGKSCLRAIERIASLKAESHLAMQKSARETAESFFNFETYSQMIGEHIVSAIRKMEERSA